ncbi:putative sugar transferase [Campylobacter coli 59-2]|nr:putative sugar transferase [Campylobacter coli 59-2]
MKSFINVRHRKNGFNEIFKININNTDCNEINDRIVYVHESNGCLIHIAIKNFQLLKVLEYLQILIIGC